MPNIVRVADVDVPVMEYRGKRVITLPMMDEIHQRPDGTARRTFNQHRQRLTEGKHYQSVIADEFRTLWPELSWPRGEHAILLTEPGYLMLVKSFQDDRAWQVQEVLVEGYYRGLAAGPASGAIDVNDLLRKYRAIEKHQKMFGRTAAVQLARTLPIPCVPDDAETERPAATPLAASTPASYIERFAADQLVRKVGHTIAAESVRSAYVAWCKAKRCEVATQTMMGRALADLGWTKARRGGRTVYLDAALA